MPALLKRRSESDWEAPMLDLRPEWLEILRQLLAVHLPDAEVWAYGSRVQGTCHQGSDLDLVARNPSDLSQPQPDLSILREAITESSIPILVEILDWARIPETFRREIVRGGTVPVQSGEMVHH